MKLPRFHPLDALLVFVPAAIAVHLAWPERATAAFVLSCLAVVPLAGLMGRATEALAARVGTGLGGTSVAISVVLLALYVLSLVFSLRTHAHLFEADAEAARETHWSMRRALLVLAGATAAVAVVSEILVASLAGAAHALGLSRLFVGVIVVAVVGNAAEHSTAVLMAMRDKMDLALQIAIESSKQVALLVAPVLVFAGLALGRPMDLVFRPPEVVAVGVSTGAITLVALDGESNWLEGAMLLAVYAVLGVAFYF